MRAKVRLESFECTELPSGKRWAEARITVPQPSPWGVIDRLLEAGFVLRRFGWGRVEMTLEGYYEDVLPIIREIAGGGGEEE